MTHANVLQKTIMRSFLCLHHRMESRKPTTLLRVPALRVLGPTNLGCLAGLKSFVQQRVAIEVALVRSGGKLWRVPVAKSTGPSCCRHGRQREEGEPAHEQRHNDEKAATSRVTGTPRPDPVTLSAPLLCGTAGIYRVSKFSHGSNYFFPQRIDEWIEMSFLK